MTKSFDALTLSLEKVPGCIVSSIASRKNGLTMFRAGDSVNIDIERLNREISMIYSSSLTNPYGDAWNFPNVHWIHLKFSSKEIIFTIPISDEYFWCVLVSENHPVRRQKEYLDRIVPDIIKEFELARSK